MEVNTLTGEVRVLKTEMIPASGRVINPLGFEGQCEGGAVMGMGYALHEDFSVPGNPRGITRNFQTYLIPTMADMPDIAVTAMEESEVTGPFGASGIVITSYSIHYTKLYEIDRLIHGYVVDFVDISFWPIFNIADVCIVSGVSILAYFLWDEEHETEEVRD